MALQNKLREQMARQFLDALNQGQLPWQACWQQDRPVNAVTGKQYRGVNALYLSYYADELGYTDPRWCTYNQAQEKGWQVRKGAKAARVEYWAYYDTKQKKLLSWQETRELLKADPEYEKHLQLRSRVYSVFNAEQIDGIPEPERNQTDIGGIRRQRDTLIRNMGIGYREQGHEAFYTPTNDTVTLPPEASFDDTYGYMATLLHECGHASGAESRMNRDLSGGFGSESYAREELRAEIASAFTAQALGLQLTDAQLRQQMERHMAYVQSWSAALKDAPEELFRAIKAAEEISDYLIEKGCFEQATPAQAVAYTHFYYQDSYLFSVAGAEEGRAMYDRLCAAADDMGFPWETEGSAYRSDALTAPASLLAPGAAQVAVYTPCTDALLREHIQQLAQQAEAVQKEDAHRRFLREAADRGRYMDEEGAFLARPSALLTPPSAVMPLIPRYPWANREQLDEIAAGIRDGLTEEQIGVYAKPEFSPIQMNSLRYALTSSLTPEQIARIADPAFDSVQMDVIRAGFEAGLTREQMAAIAQPEIPAQQMLDAYWEFRQERTRGLTPEAEAAEPDYAPDWEPEP